MPFGYIGQNQTKQKVKNSGVLSSFEISHLEKQGHAGGSLELITSTTVTSMTSAVDFTDVFTDEYATYFLQCEKVQSSVNAYTLGIQFYESGVLETAGVYMYALYGGRVDSGGTSFFESKSTTEAFINIGSDTDTDSENSSNSWVYIYNPTDSSKDTLINMLSTGRYDSTTNFRYGGGSLPQSSTVDGFRLRCTTTGNITGIFTLYGLKQ